MKIQFYNGIIKQPGPQFHGTTKTECLKAAYNYNFTINIMIIIIDF